MEKKCLNTQKQLGLITSDLLSLPPPLFFFFPFSSHSPLPPPRSLPALTQQNDDAEENGDEGPSAEASRGQEGLCLAGPESAGPLAGAHPQREGAGPAELRLTTVPHLHGQLVQLLLRLTEASPLRHDARAVV